MGPGGDGDRLQSTERPLAGRESYPSKKCGEGVSRASEARDGGAADSTPGSYALLYRLYLSRASSSPAHRRQTRTRSESGRETIQTADRRHRLAWQSAILLSVFCCLFQGPGLGLENRHLAGPPSALDLGDVTDSELVSDFRIAV